MNKYDNLGVSGEGAYGVVLKCRNKETNQLVAIKKFKDIDNPEDTEQHNTTLREIKLLKACTHPFIVRLLEAFRRKERLYLVFEYCESTVLEMTEQMKNGLNPSDVKRLILELLRAVEYLHKNRVIHRDLKPENLLVTDKQVLKLCDFGFARHVNSGATGEYPQKSLTDYVATRWYRAPELLLNCTDYTESVDVWAIGLIIAEMLTSQPLFPGDSDVDQLYLIEKTLGSLTRKETERFLRNPKFVGIKLPDFRGEGEGLVRRLGRIRDPELLSLLQNMLKMEPNERWTCRECIESHWFDEVRSTVFSLERELWRELGNPEEAPQVAEVRKRQSPSPVPAIGENDANDDQLPRLAQSRGGSRARIREENSSNMLGTTAGFCYISGMLPPEPGAFQNASGQYRLPTLPKHK